MTDIPTENIIAAMMRINLNLSFKKTKPNKVAIIILASRMEDT